MVEITGSWCQPSFCFQPQMCKLAGPWITVCCSSCWMNWYKWKQQFKQVCFLILCYKFLVIIPFYFEPLQWRPCSCSRWQCCLQATLSHQPLKEVPRLQRATWFRWPASNDLWMQGYQCLAILAQARTKLQTVPEAVVKLVWQMDFSLCPVLLFTPPFYRGWP